MDNRSIIIDEMWKILSSTGYSAQGKRAITRKVIALFKTIMRRQNKIRNRRKRSTNKQSIKRPINKGYYNY